MQHGHQLVNVLQRMVDDVHLGHLLVDGGGGHAPAQVLKAGVDDLDSVPLTRVPFDGLQVLLGSDGVAMHRMNGNEPLAWGHLVVYSCRSALCKCWKETENPDPSHQPGGSAWPTSSPRTSVPVRVKTVMP
jgi:hypothetical protein